MSLCVPDGMCNFQCFLSTRSVLIDASSPTLAEEVPGYLERDPSILPPDERDELLGGIDNAIERCYRSIRRYQRTICTLKTKRNACSKVNHLPDDLLEEIFSNCIRVESGSRDCVPLSHVCVRWRNVALGASRLWSHVVAHGEVNQSLLRLILERSLDAPLDIILCNKFSFENDHPDNPVNVATIRDMYSLVLSRLPDMRRLLIVADDQYASGETLGKLVRNRQFFAVKFEVNFHKKFLFIETTFFIFFDYTHSRALEINFNLYCISSNIEYSYLFSATFPAAHS